jgi:glycosidase
MKKEAIMHKPLSNMAYGLDKDTIIISLRSAKDDLSYATLAYGDTAYRGNPVQMTLINMEKIYTDLYFDYYEAVIENALERIVYYFILRDDIEKVYYYNFNFHKEVSLERNDLFKLPFNRKDEIIEIPVWLKEGVIYNIFPDSFASSKRAISLQGLTIKEKDYTIESKHGGTINGIIENLDYIKDLGCTVVYMNPLFKAGKYHKYDTIDYYQIDPTFGTNDDFKRLVEKAHALNMKVIIDGVFNHSGWHFFAFEDCLKYQEKSAYKDWFYALDFPIKRIDNYEEIPPYACFGYERLMPKLNTTNQAVIDYFMDVNTYWIKTYDIDGWRLDVADEVDKHFWLQFRSHAKKIKKDIAIIGEVWQTADYYLDGLTFDSTMNYDLMKHAKSFFAHHTIDASNFHHRIVQLLTRYKKPFTYAQMNLLDSHDVPRFLSHCNESIEDYKLAIIFLMTFVGVPMIYYGDEQGLSGLDEEMYRQPMQFNHNESLHAFFKSVIALRHKHQVFVDGKYNGLGQFMKEDLYCYERFDKTHRIAICLNTGDQAIALDESLTQGEVLIANKFAHNQLGPKGYLIIKRSV